MFTVETYNYTPETMHTEQKISTRSLTDKILQPNEQIQQAQYT